MIKFLLFSLFIGTNLFGFVEAQNLVCLGALIDADGTISCPTGFTVNTTTSSCCFTSPNCTAALLENGVYICPTTLTLTDGVLCCNASTTTTTNTTCRDLVGPRGYSDCPARAYLCNNTVYYTLMTQQCPRTCGRCSTTTNSTTTVTSTLTSTTCVDLAATGRTSDCPNVAYLCTNALYRSVMQVQCRRTCGFCTVTG